VTPDAGVTTPGPGGALARPAVDPITFEVIKHRLLQINDEQGATIKTLSSSPIVVEGNDFNVGLVTAEGDIAVAGPYVLTHVTTMDTIIKNILADSDEFVDGDVFLVNDPYLGALHQNDVALLAPIFLGGRLAMWAGNVLHHADLGGIDEGSFCVNATNVFQEAPRYFLKVVEAGRLSREVERTFTANSRLSEMVAIDLRAQLGALSVVRERLVGLVADIGQATVEEVMRRTVELSERRLRRRIAELPDGSWVTEVFMDGDRVGSDRIIRVRLRLTKTGDHLLFDYEGTDRQSMGAVNAPLSACYAGTIVPVYTLLCGGEIDWNGAAKHCVEVRAPLGSVMNAEFPAAVSICSIGFTWLATAAAMKVVAMMLSESEAYRDRVVPSWNVSCNGNNIFGRDRTAKLVGALLSDHRGGGAGGRSFADGFDFSGKATSHLGFLSNVESQEWKLPILYVFRRGLADSGGPGLWRGGMTAMAAVVAHKGTDMIWKSQNTAGSDQSNASGIHGGYPGAGSQCSVVRDSRIWEQYAAGEVAADLAGLGGTVEHLATKSEGRLGPADIFAFYPPGGGGYGDPLDRDPARVLGDVQNGAVTEVGARRHYGVVVRGDQVDGPATAALRVERHSERRQGSTTSAEPVPDSGPGASGDAGRRIGEYLEVVAAAETGVAVTRCRRCGTVLAPAGADPRTGAIRRTESLAHAGPWLAERFGGDSPNFVLDEAICPGCGVLFDVEERLTLDLAGRADRTALRQRVTGCDPSQLARSGERPQPSCRGRARRGSRTLHRRAEAMGGGQPTSLLIVIPHSRK
jgi:N-methylhydantoinase B